MLKYIEKGTFDKEVLQNEKPILVDFYANWCGPCKMVGPILERLGSTEETFDIAKIDVDQNQDLAIKYGVQSIPNMILFNNGNKIIGFASEDAIVDFVKKSL